MNNIFEELFGDVTGTPFGSPALDSYQIYKEKTEYKLFSLKSGKYAIVDSSQGNRIVLKLGFNKSSAKEEFVRFVKRNLGEGV